MASPYQGSSVLLYGMLPSSPEGPVVHVCALETVTGESVAVHMPPQIQQLIEEFTVLFEVPSDLPPSRQCDHTIPLVPGAASV